MDPQTVIERVRVLFVEHFHIEVPTLDTDILESGTLDSLQFVELLLHLEEQFGFRIGIENIDLDDLRTLARIARLVAGAETSSGPRVSAAN